MVWYSDFLKGRCMETQIKNKSKNEGLLGKSPAEKSESVST
jgi:hypothetical protein